MSYGEKIAELRKNSGMTQATLGAKLNVTYQAVSKWERDESVPDFATMCKIAKLFDVPLTYFENADNATVEASADESAAQSEVTVEEVGVEPEKEIVEEVEPLPAADIPVVDAPEQNIPAPSQDTSSLAVPAAVPVTPAPPDAKPATPAKPAKSVSGSESQAKKHFNYEESKVIRRRNIGLIAGGALTVAALVLSIVLLAKSTPPVNAGFAVGYCAAVIVFGYTFFTQLFWGGFIVDVVLLGGKIIGTPGIIFSFDLDGFIFLIAMKILFAVIKLLVFILTIIFFLVVAIALSPFAFAPQIIKMSRGEELD